MRVVDPATDDRLPGIAAAVAEGGRLVGYRAGRRAVAVDRSGRYVKIVRRSRAERVAALHRAVHRALDQADNRAVHRADDRAVDRPGASDTANGDRAGIIVPTVIGCGQDGRVTLSAVDGTALHDLLRTAPPRRPAVIAPATDDPVTAAIGRVGLSLARFHRSAIPDLPAPRQPDEPGQWLAIVGRAEPDAVAGLARLASTLPPVPTGGSDLVHGDLHDKNILIDGETVGLIDLDGLALGAAEDDLANLAVHLEFRALQAGLPDALGRHWAHTLLAAAATTRPLDQARLHDVRRHTWFRLACLYRFRASGRHLVPALCRRAGEDRA